MKAALQELGDREWSTSQLEMADLVARSEAATSCKLSGLSELENPKAVFKSLKEIDWAFTDDDTGYLSHDLHPYPGKFIPQIPQQIIARLSLRGELVWDCFGGCGTTALEAILMGRRALSTDINPLGKVIGEAKTLTLTKEDDDLLCDFTEQLLLLSASPERLQSELDSRRTDCEQFLPEIPNIAEWFHQNAIAELTYLRWRIERLDRDKARKLAKAAFSKSILKASFQDGETRYARKSRNVERGEVVQWFVTNLSAGLKKVRKLGPLLQFREATFKTIDLRQAEVVKQPEAEGLAANSVDLIVASPPYPNTTDYHLYHRFRLFWLGYDPRQLGNKEIGSHLRHQKEANGFDFYLKEMTCCLRRMEQVLRPGRYVVLVLGNGIFNGKSYDTALRVSKAAQKVGFEVVGTLNRTVHSTKRSFISAARRLRTEDLLVLRKPPSQLALTLFMPPYKLWPYEEQLRKREIEALLGSIPAKIKDGSFRISTNALSLDKVRKLTFTHRFAAPDVSQEATWQAILENGDATIRSQRKDPKYATHGIHAYKGKFYPQLAKSLFSLAGLSPGAHVLDPFCGSGTVLLECYLNGFQGFGTDLNVLANKIARVKTQILGVDPYLRDRFLSRFEDRLSGMESSSKWHSVFAEDSRDELLSWFPRPVLAKLGWLLHTIGQVSEPRIREFLEVIASSIVRDVSQQDPRDLRIRRRAEPLSDAPVYELFKDRLHEQRIRLQHFSERSKYAPLSFHAATAILGDSRLASTFRDNGIERGSVDAIVTSPPYATALPYIDTDRLSILLLFGLDSKERSTLEASLVGSREITKRKKNGVDERIDAQDFADIQSTKARAIVEEIRQRNKGADVGFRRDNTAALLYLYFQDMSKVMQNLDPLLRRGSSAFFVIGDNRTIAGGKEIKIESGKVLQEIGESIGWEVADVIPITVTTENRLHAKNSITANEIIRFRKR
ncbi:MAG: DNA methyltransferase [Acidobacteriota bacterium]